MSRSSYAGSTNSQTSAGPKDRDVPGGYPESEASHVVSSEQSLSEAVHARRAEFTRPHTIRIKVGTWNVAGKKGTEHDVTGWFVGGQGVSESLSGLEITNCGQSNGGSSASLPPDDRREGVGEQEARRTTKGSTLPRNDPGQLPAGEEIGLYVLGLQEIVDITSVTEAVRPYTDPSSSLKWKEKLEAGLPMGYRLVSEQQLIGLMLFIYASPAVLPHVGSVSTTSCGTGLMGYMGNKGAVTTRIVLGETTRLVFINCHLSSGVGKAELDRRNWDTQQILSRTRFDPIADSLGSTASRGERIGEEDFAFWFGDLNYRLEGIPGNDVRRLLMLHTRNEYDLSQASARKIEKELASDTDSAKRREAEHNRASSSASSITSSNLSSSMASIMSDTDSVSTRDTVEGTLDPGSDPAHLQTTIDSILPHDELHQQQKTRKMFHDGWREGPVTFLPTYKYDVGSVGVFDTGDKKRGPSWCDRILYRTRKDKLDYENMLIEEEDAKKKDADMTAKGIDKAAADEDMLYDYDPEADGEDEQQGDSSNKTSGQPTSVMTKEGFEDIITLEYYVSHQRVLSSDHKPLDAIFKLEYDAAIPELKAKVHHEVARALDRAENEGRPVVTLIVDGTSSEDHTESDGVDFRGVRYEDDKVRSLTVANTGRAAADFGLVSQPIGKSQTMATTPRWLTADIDLRPHQPEDPKHKKERPEWCKDIPYIYRLEPGEACSIRLTAGVHTRDYARKLNQSEQLESVLILRVKDGRDHFVPVRGTWKQSVHGRAIDALCRIPEGGVRRLQSQRADRSKHEHADENAVMWSAPREIFRLTEAIENLVERVLAEASILSSQSEHDGEHSPWLEVSGWPLVSESWTLEADARRVLRVEVNEALDTDQPFAKTMPTDTIPLHQLEALAEGMLRFLADLEDGVITEELWQSLEKDFFSKNHGKVTLPVDEQRASVLEVLSAGPKHSTSFILVTSMLGRIIQELANYRQQGPPAVPEPSDLPLSPKSAVRRKTLDVDPGVAASQLARKNLAIIFAEAMIRSPEPATAKIKATIQQQKQELVELFLDAGAT